MRDLHDEGETVEVIRLRCITLWHSEDNRCACITGSTPFCRVFCIMVTPLCRHDSCSAMPPLRSLVQWQERARENAKRAAPSEEADAPSDEANGDDRHRFMCVLERQERPALRYAAVHRVQRPPREHVAGHLRAIVRPELSLRPDEIKHNEVKHDELSLQEGAQDTPGVHEDDRRSHGDAHDASQDTMALAALMPPSNSLTLMLMLKSSTLRSSLRVSRLLQRSIQLPCVSLCPACHLPRPL
ncbi:MAG: hypothetical protein JRH20_18285 [Deltaproteobacteria bacterium]|nr:hypothetical protein [Deltaproteobacteria bacterium]